MCDFYCKDGSVPFHDYLRCKSTELQINGLLTVFNLKFPSTQLSLLRNSQWTGTSGSTSLLQLSLIGGHCCKGWAFSSALLPGSLALCFHRKRNGQKNWLHLFVEEVLLVNSSLNRRTAESGKYSSREGAAGLLLSAGAIYCIGLI